jgi:hypothetical protein
MSNLVETLESRTFLSASALVITLHADEATAKADLVSLDKAGVAVEKTLKTDLASVAKATAVSQYKALTTAFSGLIKADTKALSVATGKVDSDANRLVAAQNALARSPNSVTLTAKVTADKAALTADAAADLTAIQTANNGVPVDGTLATIESDAGSAATDAETATTTLGTDAQAFSTAADAAFSTDVAAIVAA